MTLLAALTRLRTNNPKGLSTTLTLCRQGRPCLHKKSAAYLRERLTPLIGKTATMRKLARELGSTRSD
jgi:hypothetical protein